MLIYIVLLWMAYQMQAPLWIYIIIVLGFTLRAVSAVLDLIAKGLEKRVKEAEEQNEKLRALSGRMKDDDMDSV